ncbi:hypothetical protein DXC33_12480 [Clostridiaceae bacterium TF01-6]|nr:hypothetical protein DXC33_12480 [Clostridiaceae bacterium TF01-6]
MLQVNVRGGFSDRNKIKPMNTEIQLKKFDARTRNQIANVIGELYNTYMGSCAEYEEYVQGFYRFVLGQIYGQQVDYSERYYYNDIFKNVNETIQLGQYDDILTLVEALAGYWAQECESPEYYGVYVEEYIYKKINEVFEREFVGYRFIDRYIVPISDRNEIQAINDSLKNPYEDVREHIKKANKLLADRDNPDYENSIKESISAVEAMCKILTGSTGNDATLGKMLKNLEDKGIKIHSAMKNAFNSLYGYTSDAKGIRHAGDLGGEKSTFADAKFMLVACSAFINYLHANEAKSYL